MSDIVDEIKNWRDERDYPTPGEVMDRAIAEITRLRAEVGRLRLTHEELEAVREAVAYSDQIAPSSGIPDPWQIRAFRDLLARLGGDK